LLVFYDVLVAIGLLIAVLFSLLVLLTGKGDAMSGGGGVRTTFKGKASFDDIMSRWTLGLGVSFMILMLVIDWVSTRLPNVIH
jgi:preprotein translocase subunit SecG